MRKYIAWIRILAEVTTIWLLLCSLSLAQSSAPSVAVSYVVPESITLHEPIIVDVSIINLLPNEITVVLGPQSKSAFAFTAIMPDGRSEDGPQLIRSGSSGIISLKAGQQYSQRLILNEWLEFPVAGKYRVMATAGLPISTDGSDFGLQAVEGSFEVTILPRDEKVLRQRCDTLIRKLRASRRQYDRFDLAEELSFLRDPIAIPYLTQLANEQEEHFAIEGLRRIGTDEAWEAMIEVTKSEYDKGAAAYAKTILREKVREIHDEKIRAKVNAAIQ